MPTYKGMNVFKKLCCLFLKCFSLENHWDASKKVSWKALRKESFINFYTNMGGALFSLFMCAFTLCMQYMTFNEETSYFPFQQTFLINIFLSFTAGLAFSFFSRTATEISYQNYLREQTIEKRRFRKR